MRIRTLFSGIGAPESALKRLGIDYELVDFCEIDKYAVQSYCAMHNEPPSKNLGDVSKVWGRELPYADLLVWGFPCTDISVAGKQAGIIKGETRSGLYYEGFRILKETKPKYSVIENVKNLTGKKFKAEFKQMLSDIEELGYNNYWKVLNAKDYGIPQNRERVFVISIRKDVDTGFEFPLPMDNKLRLKDFLEDEVEEKFYISQEKTALLISQIKKQGDIDKMSMINSQQLCKLDKPYVDNQFASMMGAVSIKDIGNETAGTITARYCKGIGADGDNAICTPCLTPDRLKKRQNGRRFKENGDSMFTITSQDRHGVLIKQATKVGHIPCGIGGYSREVSLAQKQGVEEYKMVVTHVLQYSAVMSC